MKFEDFLKSNYIWLIIIAIAFIAGRYSSPEKVVTVTQVVTKEVKTEDDQIDSDRVSDVLHILKPDGTKITRIKVEAKKDESLKDSKRIDSSTFTSKTIEYRRGVYAQALIGLPMSDISSGPVYGVSISKQFFGPIVLGAWGLSNLTVGLSVGLEL